jgi:lipoprotein-releasing system permease protein
MKFKQGWTFFLALRYIFSPSGRKNSPGTKLSILGIATGTAALITVISVINGFQMGFIDDILNIGSYHIQVESPDESWLDSLKSGDKARIKSAVPYAESEVLCSGVFAENLAVQIRGIPADMEQRDPEFRKQMDFFIGKMDFASPSEIVLGQILAMNLGVSLGDTISVFAFNSGCLSEAGQESLSYTVAGIFKSGFFDYDASLAFTNLDEMEKLSFKSVNVKWGVKLFDRFDAPYIRHSLQKANPQLRISTWEEVNSAFFGALAMEKNMMFFLLMLIYLVVALNISSSLQRRIWDRKEEITILTALGAGPSGMKSIFLVEGFMIGVAGSILGLIAGLGLCVNLDSIMDFISATASAAVSFVTRSPSGAPVPGFYFIDLPVRIVWQELVFIFCSGIFFALAAAWRAGHVLSQIKPLEVLRYE